MNCKECQKLLEENFRSGKTTLADDLKRHVVSCSSCAAFSEELRALGSILAGSDPKVLPGELDDITFERIVSEARGTNVKPAHAKPRVALRWAWAPAAAAVVIVALLIPKLYDGSTDQIIYDPLTDLTAVEIIDDIASSDSLGVEVLASLADDANLDYLVDELAADAEVDDLLGGLSQGELENLYDKIEDLSSES
jgi:hypothetical protein